LGQESEEEEEEQGTGKVKLNMDFIDKLSFTNQEEL
jgi:hypothetical protein